MLFANHVKILDISLGGVSVKSDKRLNIGSEYTLKIKVKSNNLIFKGKVIWSLISENRENSHGDIIPIYTAGLKFMDFSSEKIKEIADFIEAYRQEVDKPIDVYQDSGMRLFTRFQITAPQESFILNCYEGCKVKELSINGMLMESEHPAELEDKIPLKLTLAEDKSITFQGSVVSCLLINPAPESYDLEIEFIDMSKSDKDVLAEFICLLDARDKGQSR
jgi:hypothetical protein